MLQHFLRRKDPDDFRTRAAERDELSDRKTLGGIAKAIDRALAALEAERTGLSQRFKDARDGASVAVGTEHDEYLSREPTTLAELRGFEEQMIRASRRLAVLHEEIANLRLVRAVFYFRFGTSASEHRPS